MPVKSTSKPSTRGSHPFANAEEVYHGEVPSRLDQRHIVIADVLRTLNRDGAQTDPYVDRLHLDEALINAMIHGNRLDESRTVTVRAFFDRERWGYEVNDDSAGFDPTGLNTRNLDKRLERGLGSARASGHELALIRTTSGDLHFFRDGRTTVIVRRTDHTCTCEGPDSQ